MKRLYGLLSTVTKNIIIIIIIIIILTHCGPVFFRLFLS
jgi:lipopolysaccharide/colanic/teichoic acid biosynthesis glycosyltransferase